MMTLGRTTLAGTLAATLWIAFGCSGDAVGIDACRRIEETRCRAAPSCNIPLTPPLARAGREIEGCISYYRDACLHGLPSAEPARADVDACIAGIQSSCAYVAKPETHPSCAFLIPNAPPAVDAGNPIVLDAATD